MSIKETSKWKCLSAIFMINLIIFLVFLLVFIPARRPVEGNSAPSTRPRVSSRGVVTSPKFTPLRTTYITRGDKPTWVPVQPGEVVYVPEPQLDTHLAFYKQQDVAYYQALIRDLVTSLTPRFMGNSLAMLMRLRELFPRQTQEKLLEWASMSQGSPYNGLPFFEMVYQTGVLVTKTDPSGLQISCRKCFLYDFHTLLSPDTVCAGSGDIDIIAIITTVPKAYQERKAIRETWASWSVNNTSSFRYLFLLGGGWSEKVNQDLEEEQALYGDILQDDYMDTYYNLSYKVLGGYKWVERNCPRAKFVMRTADDNFINVMNMIELVRRYGHERTFQDYQVGICYVNYKPYRWPDFKGYVSTDEYRYDIFPPYALGTTFLTSMKLTKDILRSFSDVPFMSIEDSYFGILLWRMSRGCHHVEKFNENSEQFAKPPYYSQHPVTPKQIYSFFEKVQKQKQS